MIREFLNADLWFLLFNAGLRLRVIACRLRWLC